MVLLILSLLGFFLFFRQVSGKLQPAFYPALTVSMISCVLFLIGFWGEEMSEIRKIDGEEL